ncbi:MAG: hypothetical protein KC777_18420 [Cyanobacteria bacterium HKST-UBA02]|nr:hypothetical protein [Cyanobacteria bacterium HKST-UBA02]
MSELTSPQENMLDAIQDFGTQATRVSVWGSESMEDLKGFYHRLNPNNNTAIRSAVMMELKERGILPAFTIENDGTVDFAPEALTPEQQNAAVLGNCLRALTPDRIEEIAGLTDRGEDNQMSLADINAALLEPASEEERMALEYVRKNFDDITTDGLFDGDDIGLDELRDYATDHRVDPASVYDLARRADNAQSNILQGLDESELYQAENIDSGHAKFEVRAGDGFDLIARQIYMDAFGERPSIRDEVDLSLMIAAMNGNDRLYANGIIHPGQILTVPDNNELEELFSRA